MDKIILTKKKISKSKISREESSKSEYSIISIDRITLIFNTFLKNECELTPTEISRITGLPQSTIYRYLMSLSKSKLIEFNEQTRKFSLGVLCLTLGEAFTRQNDLGNRALPILTSLRDSCGETIHLGVKDGNNGVYLNKLQGLHSIGLLSSKIGNSFNLYSTGIGKVIIANIKEEELVEFLKNNKLKSFTPNTLTDPNKLLIELETIRSQGYAIDNEENEFGVMCVSAPVFDINGLRGGISVSGPIERLKKEIEYDNLIEKVIVSAKTISKKLGANISHSEIL